MAVTQTYANHKKRIVALLTAVALVGLFLYADSSRCGCRTA